MDVILSFSKLLLNYPSITYKQVSVFSSDMRFHVCHALSFHMYLGLGMNLLFYYFDLFELLSVLVFFSFFNQTLKFHLSLLCLGQFNLCFIFHFRDNFIFIFFFLNLINYFLFLPVCLNLCF